jgi:serine/threonine protein kinase
MRNFKQMKAIENIEDHYELGKVLGNGSYGVVFKAKSKLND